MTMPVFASRHPATTIRGPADSPKRGPKYWRLSESSDELPIRRQKRRQERYHRFCRNQILQGGQSPKLPHAIHRNLLDKNSYLERPACVQKKSIAKRHCVLMEQSL